MEQRDGIREHRRETRKVERSEKGRSREIETYENTEREKLRDRTGDGRSVMNTCTVFAMLGLLL